MNVLGMYLKGVIKRDYVRKSDGKAGSFDLLDGVFYPYYPTTRGAVSLELPIPKTMDLKVNPVGWHFVFVPLKLEEDDYGNMKRPAFNWSKAVFVAHKDVKSLKGELRAAFEAYESYFDITSSLPDPNEDDDEPYVPPVKNTAAPVTQRPEGMTLANKV